MHVGKSLVPSIVFLAFLIASSPLINATPRKVHVVALGAVRRVPYSKTGDPAGAATGEDALKIRPLVVDGAVKEWTTGDAHDVTDRSFVVRRVLRLNDELPGEKSEKHWVWQRGPWLLVDRVTGHVTALKLPDYDPGVSQVIWFRDYAAYCGVTASGKSLYAVVAQLSVRKPVLAKKLTPLDSSDRSQPACSAPSGNANLSAPPSTQPAKKLSASTLSQDQQCSSKNPTKSPKRLSPPKPISKGWRQRFAPNLRLPPGCAKLNDDAAIFWHSAPKGRSNSRPHVRQPDSRCTDGAPGTPHAGNRRSRWCRS